MTLIIPRCLAFLWLDMSDVHFRHVSEHAEVVVKSIKRPDQVMARGSFRPTAAVSKRSIWAAVSLSHICQWAEERRGNK